MFNKKDLPIDYIKQMEDEKEIHVKLENKKAYQHVNKKIQKTNEVIKKEILNSL